MTGDPPSSIVCGLVAQGIQVNLDTLEGSGLSSHRLVLLPALPSRRSNTLSLERELQTAYMRLTHGQY